MCSVNVISYSSRCIIIIVIIFKIELIIISDVNINSDVIHNFNMNFDSQITKMVLIITGIVSRYVYVAYLLEYGGKTSKVFINQYTLLVKANYVLHKYFYFVKTADHQYSNC